MSDDGWEEESSTTPSFGGGAVREIILLFNLASYIWNKFTYLQSGAMHKICCNIFVCNDWLCC